MKQQFLFLLISFSSLCCLGQETFLDVFDEVSYANNDGTLNFSTNWVETGDNASPTNGVISVRDNNFLRFRQGNGTRNVGNTSLERSLDLSLYNYVTLDLNHSGQNRGGEALEVQLLNNFDGSWDSIAILNSNTSNTPMTTHVLTANQISNNARIRFISSSGTWNTDDRIFINDVLFTARVVEVSINDVRIDENAGNAVFTITHSGDDVPGGFSVDFSTIPNTAESSDDFVQTNGTINFNGTTQRTQTISIPIINDNLAEIDETFFVNLSNSSIPTILINTQGLGTISENDNASVAVTEISVSEDIGTATYTATLTGGAVEGGFTVDYTTEDGTATFLGDYETTSGTLTFIGSENEIQTFTIPITNNAYAENDEFFFINLSNASSALVNVNITSGQIITDDVGDMPIQDNVSLTIFEEFNGYYDYAVTAGTLRTADENDDPCSITTSSSNTLTTPIADGSTIRKAYLLWGHSGRNPDDTVSFEGQSVTADLVNSAGGGFFYGMVADVTSLIKNQITDPSTNVYDFSDLDIDNGPTYCGSVVFGGWSLYILYTNPNLPAVSINMYNGFDSQGGNTNIVSTNYTLDNFYAIDSSGSKTTVLSWEGDRLRTGSELISITTSNGTTNLTGDGSNSPTNQNVFNSTIYDNTATTTINDSSLFGFDLDTYDISAQISPGDTSATTTVQTQGDFIILNSVLLKVPSNLITGTIFEDMNYSGGVGRSKTMSDGVGIEGVVIELFDNTGNLIDSDITDEEGVYNIGGMENGNYSLRVVNSSVSSNRGGGNFCSSCLPVQTFRTEYVGSTINGITNEIGGANPFGEDTATGVLTGAQTVSNISITNEGAVNIDFGFNFNTIVNTNENGQGSLDQFVINANNLEGTDLDIEAHPNNASLNPAAAEEVSVFMIPPTNDPLGRTADTNFANGYFDITISNSIDLTTITEDNTQIDGRWQTAYSGDTNIGATGAGGTKVGTSSTALPNYELPEIQVHQNNGNVITIEAENTVVRNVSVYANNNAGIRINSGSATIANNLIGVNAEGNAVQNNKYGIRMYSGSSTIENNYISNNTIAGIRVQGADRFLVQKNHLTTNGRDNCYPNIWLDAGSSISIQQNLIENAEAIGIEDNVGNLIIIENTITTSGTNNSCLNNSGVLLSQGNSSIVNNIISSNAGAGISITGNTSGNLITQNSIYANGTITPALGIDLGNDGVTINDSSDLDIGGNELYNFPVFESITSKSNALKVIGWARPGAIIELFLTDIAEGSAIEGDNEFSFSQDYGEGQTYLGTIIEGGANDLDATTAIYTDADGNTDNTNRFNITLNLTETIPIKTKITATATSPATNSTSEFGNTYAVRSGTVITNRRITYRVTAPDPLEPGVPTGSPSTNLRLNNNFSDASSFNINFNNNGSSAVDWELLISNRPYSMLPADLSPPSNSNTYAISTKDNGDGTYNYLLSSKTSLIPGGNVSINGSAPTPPGDGGNDNNCNCITFYIK